jgi:lysophospholipase L1-like esterase
MNLRTAARTIEFVCVAMLTFVLFVHLQGVEVTRSISENEINPEQGHAYIVNIGQIRKYSVLRACSDAEQNSYCSEAVVYEDGIPLPGAHTSHDSIRKDGGGKYSHWQTELYFSASDNSDPRSNGRKYRFATKAHLPRRLLYLISSLLFLILAVESVKLVRRALKSPRLAAIPLTVLLLAALYIRFVGIPVTITINSKDITQRQENEFQVPLRNAWGIYFPFKYDSSDDGNASPTKVYEDGAKLRQPHQSHVTIQHLGAGRFSHWNDDLHFSSTDYSDPRSNGKTYRVEARYSVSNLVFYPLLALFTTLIFWCAYRFGGFWRVIIESAACGVAAYLISLTGGMIVWFLMGATVVAASLAIVEISRMLFFPNFTLAWRKASYNLAFVFGSAFLAMALAEGGLLVAEKTGVPLNSIAQKIGQMFSQDGQTEAMASIRWEVRPDQILDSEVAKAKTYRAQVEVGALAAKSTRKSLLALPPEWNMKTVDIPGASYAYTWHNALHVYDDDHFRRTAPFPPKDSHKFRIMVLGDSLTYGIGIDEQWSYPRVLQRFLNPDYNVEVLNLGVSGFQSEDTVGVAKRFLHRLNPDLVIYGMCLNDFLNSGEGEGDAAPFKIPKFLTDNTRVGQLLSRGLEGLFLKLGIMKTFHGQIAERIDQYKVRFSNDMKELNKFVTGAGLPPVTAMVLTQLPNVAGVDRQLALLAEDSLRNAGINVVSLAGFNAAFAGESFRVSAWEGHPDEEANNIYAMYLRDELVAHKALNGFKR